MSTPAKNIREALARVSCGVAGQREVGQIKAALRTLTYELDYNEEGSWFQCRHCHRREEEGHDESCLAVGAGL